MTFNTCSTLSKCSSIMLVILVCLLSNTLISAEGSIYDEEIYKQSVDYNAQVIEPKRTFELLLQLKDLIPAEESEMRQDLDKLINISLDDDLSNCDSAYMYMNDYVNKDVNSLSSPSRDKHYGPNIIAYIQYSGAKMIEKCSNILTKSISQISPLDLALVRSFSQTIGLFENSQDYLRYKNENFPLGTLRYLENNIINFKKKVSHEKGQLELSSRLSSLDSSCKRVLTLAKPIGFISGSIADNLFSELIFNNALLKEWASIRRYCQLLINRTDYTEIYKAYQGYGLTYKMKQLLKKPQ